MFLFLFLFCFGESVGLRFQGLIWVVGLDDWMVGWMGMRWDGMGWMLFIFEIPHGFLLVVSVGIDQARGFECSCVVPSRPLV